MHVLKIWLLSWKFHFRRHFRSFHAISGTCWEFLKHPYAKSQCHKTFTSLSITFRPSMWWKSGCNHGSSIVCVISGLLMPVALVAHRKIGNESREHFRIQFFTSFPKIHKLIMLKQVSKRRLDHFLAPRSANPLFIVSFCSSNCSWWLSACLL